MLMQPPCCNRWLVAADASSIWSKPDNNGELRVGWGRWWARGSSPPAPLFGRRKRNALYGLPWGAGRHFISWPIHPSGNRLPRTA